MKITPASPADLDEAVSCLATAFGQDPITGYLLQTGSGYHERVSRFFAILMRARLALEMPVFVARSSAGIGGAAMGHTTVRPEWPSDLTEEWYRFEKAVPGMPDRMSIYDEAAARCRRASIWRRRRRRTRFYERAGFVETGRGTLGSSTLWCMYLAHNRR